MWGTVEVLHRCDKVVLFHTTEKLLPRTSLGFFGLEGFSGFFS